MKKLMFAVVLAVATGAFADMKVGVVDLMTLVKNHPNYESNKSLLSSTDKDYQKKLDVIKAEGEKIQEEGKKLAEQIRNPMLAPKAKSEIENKLMDVQKRLVGIEQRYRSEAMRCRQDLQDLEGRLLKTTSDDLRKRIAKYAEANGYDLVLETTATAFSKKSYDLTDVMLREMGVDPKEAKGRDEGK